MLFARKPRADRGIRGLESVDKAKGEAPVAGVLPRLGVEQREARITWERETECGGGRGYPNPSDEPPGHSPVWYECGADHGGKGPVRWWGDEHGARCPLCGAAGVQGGMG